jgi:Zn-dependent protease with chaperone function
MNISRRALVAVCLLLGPYVVAAGVALALILGVVLAARTGSGGFLLLMLGLVAVLAFGVGRVLLPTFRRTTRPASGVELSRSAQPRLWTAIDGLADAVGTRTPDELRLVPDVTVRLTQNGRMLGLRPHTRRLSLGMPLLSGLTELQLRALIAHELGHYSARHDALAGVTYRGMEAWRALVAELDADSITGRIVLRYSRFYRSVSDSVIRRQEVEADWHSVQVAGKGATAAALRETAAMDRAWATFLDRYGDLGSAERRRPLALFDGFQQFLADPARQLQLVEVRNAPGGEASPDSDGHPPPASRIAAMDKCPADGVIDDCTPALSLLDQPEQVMSELEAWMFDGSGLTPTSWDDLATAAGAATVRAGAGLLTTAAEESGVAKPATLNAVFDALRRGETGAMVGPLLEPDAPELEWNRLAERLLTHLVANALIDAGLASYRLNWSGPSVLVGPDDMPLDPGPLIAHAIDDPTAAYALQGWLTACGVLPDYRVDTTTAGDLRPERRVGTGRR